MAFVQFLRLSLRSFHKTIISACEYRLPDEARAEFRNLADGFQSLPLVADPARICDKKPIKVNVKKGQTYMWCACGYSNHQPFCDRTHANTQLRIRQQPVRFVPDRDGSVWLCMCKRSQHRPFCDGSHKQDEVQEAIK